MSAPDAGRRVALLARPGPARDCVRAALLEVGAELVTEDDPAQADPGQVRASGAQVLMIVLDPAAEDALGRFDSVIGDPGIEVMFEEADVAVSREGWEAARWRRHLAAKLLRNGDVLPPVGHVADGLPPAADVGPAPAVVSMEEAIEEGLSRFDPVAAEDAPPAIEGLEFDAAAFDSSAFNDAGLELGGFDGGDLPPVTGPDFSAADFDPLLAELDAQLPEPVRDWEGGLVEGFGQEAPAAPDEEPEGKAPGFGELTLSDEAPLAAAPSRGCASHDLADLERRISSLSLVDDAPRTPGVVVVVAGLGGPDAVRQFLGALPEDFRCPVLVRQHLDGARYDKLVAQMQRATPLPVSLAEAGRPLATGTVYVVGDGMGLDGANGLRFAADANLLDTLPPDGAAVVVLSGASPDDADRIAALGKRGTWLGAQASDGCYDPAAAEAVAARGAASAPPADLARQLVRHWAS